MNMQLYRHDSRGTSQQVPSIEGWLRAVRRMKQAEIWLTHCQPPGRTPIELVVVRLVDAFICVHVTCRCHALCDSV